jgi:Biopolymer transport protein ExbD/TolR
MLGFDNMSGRSLKESNDLTLCSVVIDVPVTAHNLAYGLFMTGTGQVWVNELKIEEVGADVAVTALPLGKIRQGRTYPTSPVNLDFDSESSPGSTNSHADIGNSPASTKGAIKSSDANRKLTDTVTISIAKNGALTVNGTAVNERDLSDVLQSIHTEENTTTVLLRVDEKSPVQNLTGVWDACRKSGFTKIHLQSKDSGVAPKTS